MSSKKDISQIKKYLKGELDARAMHQLEMRALDDPFLMDSLEGYEQAGRDQHANLDELANRLQQRTDKKVRRIIPWVQLSVAASILIILGIGILLITNNQPVKQNRLAEAVKPVSQDKKITAPSALPKNDSLLSEVKPDRAIAYSNKLPDTINNQKTVSAQYAPVTSKPMSAATQQTLKNYKADKDTMALNELVVSNYDFKKKSPINDSLKSYGYNSASVKTDFKSRTQDQILPGKVDGVTITKQPTPADINELYSRGLTVPGDIGNKDIISTKYNYKVRDTSALKNVTVAGYAAKRKKDVSGSIAAITAASATPGNRITGRIVSRDDGEPIVGATVKIVGSTHGVATDAVGRFILPNAPGDQTLSVAYIGYNTKQVKVNGRDSLNIALEPNTSSLSEVVVTTPKEADVSSESAHPLKGWPVFRDYLKKNAASTDGVNGKVRLSFMVDGSGNLSGFKIIKSLSKTADQKAIDLVQYGTGWVGNANGKPEEVKVTIKFH